jgi:hypothetical protein
MMSIQKFNSFHHALIFFEHIYLQQNRIQNTTINCIQIIYRSPIKIKVRGIQEPYDDPQVMTIVCKIK